ncbi:MAG: hypothetical protein WC188_09565 [Candidatus Caldatribacteriota bacterium]|jgi:DNA integrity scanning protein DisA with diadenylate cyclase activity
MMDNFMTLEMLSTFAGLVIATGLIVQFTKDIVKSKFSDIYVRLYTFIISLILTFVFACTGYDIDNIILTIINSIIVSITAMGGYELISDPKAKK